MVWVATALKMEAARSSWAGALVDEGLDVGLGEDATARRDRVELRVAGRHLSQARGVRVQEGRHLVDERARSARARAVHALLGSGVQVGELGVLAAQLDDDVDLGWRRWVASVPAMTSWTKGIPMARAVVRPPDPVMAAWTRAPGRARSTSARRAPRDARTSALWRR